MNQRIVNLHSLIGNTPMLEVSFTYKGEPRRIFAKAEYLNMTGSIKDRMAYHILFKAYQRGIIEEGAPIFEATSGNTGIAFSAIGRAAGHPVTIFMPDWMSAERINLIRSFGAKIRLVSKEEGGFLGSIAMADEIATSSQGAFRPQQFSNVDNCEAHYLTTGPEIFWQMKYRHLEIDAFVAGVGTGGTVMGVGKFLSENCPNSKIHPLEPTNSPTLSTGYKVGNHRIQGISDEFIPSIVNLNELDEIICVDDGDSIVMAQQLSEKLGIGVGISSGANFLGALLAQNKLGSDSNVVTIFSDDNKKYLSTDLMRPEPVKKDFLTKDIELISFNGFKRVCQTCCDPSNCVEANFNGDTQGFELPYCPRRG